MKIEFVRRFIFWSIIGVYALLTYWMFWPYTPIIIQEPIRILNPDKIVKQGDFLIYELDMDKRMALPAVISKQIVNDFVMTYSPIIGNLEVGKCVKLFKVPVSQAADPGEYRFKWEGSYKVNPIRWVTVVVWSEPFQVIQ